MYTSNQEIWSSICECEEIMTEKAGNINVKDIAILSLVIKIDLIYTHTYALFTNPYIFMCLQNHRCARRRDQRRFLCFLLMILMKKLVFVYLPTLYVMPSLV